MGLILSRLWARFSSVREYRILMLGLDAAGKTTVLYKLKVSIEKFKYDSDDFHCAR